MRAYESSWGREASAAAIRACFIFRPCPSKFLPSPLCLATVNHISTPYRFALTLADPTTIGRRRAAQRIMAAALKQLSFGEAAAPDARAVDAALHDALRSMAPA